MVDIGATTHAGRAARSPAGIARAASDLTVSVRTADEDALDGYERFCVSAVHAPAQHPTWVRSWLSAVNGDAIIAFVQRGGTTVAALALEVVQQGPFRIARFAGGNHANGNFVATLNGGCRLQPSDRQQLIVAIKRARPDVDMVLLERQNPFQDGLENPLAAFRTMQSPNVSLAVDLTGGFDAVLSRHNGKRKRKKHKQQARRFDEAGGFRVIDARTPDQVERLMTAFFVMKAARFRTKGIPNVFEPPEIQRFFRQLYLGALAQDLPSFGLQGVEVGGELCAVNGLSIQQQGVVCEFGGIRDDVNASPGFFLDYVSIERACKERMKIYDFSVGDEEYKRSWCDIETWQFDIMLPLTAKGRLAFAYRFARTWLVGHLKRNGALWALAKDLRKRGAGAAKAGDE